MPEVSVFLLYIDGKCQKIVKIVTLKPFLAKSDILKLLISSGQPYRI